MPRVLARSTAQTEGAAAKVNAKLTDIHEPAIWRRWN